MKYINNKINNENKTKYMQFTRKTNLTKQDIEVTGTSYEAVNQFVYLGSQINRKIQYKKKLD
jgi:hypothetical protein